VQHALGDHALLPVLVRPVVPLQVLLVGLLHRLALLVQLLQLLLDAPQLRLALLQRDLAGHLDLSVQVLCEFEGVAGALLVLDLEGGGDVGDGGGLVGVDVLLQLPADLQQRLRVVDLYLDALLEGVREVLERAGELLDVAEGVLRVQLGGTGRTLK
jgi:hypothetical protein